MRTGLDDHPWRRRMADHLPLVSLLTLALGIVEAVDLGIRMRSRIGACCPTAPTRENHPTPGAGSSTTTSSAANNVVELYVEPSLWWAKRGERT